MRLELDRLDLKPGFVNVAMREIAFEHLNDRAQVSIISVGSGVIYEFDRSNYSAIYPPRDVRAIRFYPFNVDLPNGK